MQQRAAQPQPRCPVAATASGTVRVAEHPPPTDAVLRRRDRPTDVPVPDERTDTTTPWTHLHGESTEELRKLTPVPEKALHPMQHTQATIPAGLTQIDL